MESIAAAFCNAWLGRAPASCGPLEAGIPSSRAFGQKPAGKNNGGLSFAQISDSHIGFNKPANPDVNATLQAAIEKIGALQTQPEFMLPCPPAQARDHSYPFSSVASEAHPAGRKIRFHSTLGL
jgi:hypothetical protein